MVFWFILFIIIFFSWLIYYIILINGWAPIHTATFLFFMMIYNIHINVSSAEPKLLATPLIFIFIIILLDNLIFVAEFFLFWRLWRWGCELVSDVVVHIKALLRYNPLHGLIQLDQVVASVQQVIFFIYLVVRLLILTVAPVTLIGIFVPVIQIIRRHFFVQKIFRKIKPYSIIVRLIIELQTENVFGDWDQRLSAFLLKKILGSRILFQALDILRLLD